ncbi:MAG TPA: hypothetical protein VKI61_04520 [Chitinophagaceae bacterium]|jgi:hypothetical protein|nr:hypothetical protein [Chitinophagaceae bacterium]
MLSDYCKKWRGTKRLLLIAAFAGMLLFSCKKAIQQQEENIIVNAVTSGHWYVELYTQDSTDITNDFLGYEFQFYKNNNVDGIKNSVTTTGTWSTDINAYTITSAFPGNASDTLKLLNYTWKITDSYLDYVEAKTTTSNGDNILHLRKK